MIGLVLTIALAAAVLWALWSVSRPRPAFVVRIVRGLPQVARGTVTPAFVQEVAEVCRRHGVRDGTVRGMVQDRRIALAFSGNMPAPCRQQLRNLWNISGWSSGKGRKRSR
jgi:Protein of unknown function (DUF3634)